MKIPASHLRPGRNLTYHPVPLGVSRSMSVVRAKTTPLAKNNNFKKGSRRRPQRRSVVTRRVISNPFNYRIPGNSPLTIRRTSVQILTSQTTGGSGFFFSANPTNAPNFDTDFGNLFSVFRALRTTFTWIPAFGTNEVASADSVFLAPIYTVIDPSITTVPTTESEMLQCGSFKVTNMNRRFSRSCVPSLAVAVGPSGFMLPPAKNFWIPTGTDPQMNGMRMFVCDFGQSAATYLGRMLITYHFQLNGTN